MVVMVLVVMLVAMLAMVLPTVVVLLRVVMFRSVVPCPVPVAKVGVVGHVAPRVVSAMPGMKDAAQDVRSDGHRLVGGDSPELGLEAALEIVAGAGRFTRKKHRAEDQSRSSERDEAQRAAQSDRCVPSASTCHHDLPGTRLIAGPL